MKNILYLVFIMSTFACGSLPKEQLPPSSTVNGATSSSGDTTGQSLNDNVTVITYDSAAGECAGYCYRKITINHGGITVLKRSWDGSLPEVILHQTISADQWNGLLGLIDVDGVMQLPPQISPCAGCADAPIHNLTLTFKDGFEKSVQYDSMTVPKVLKDLDQELSKQLFP